MKYKGQRFVIEALSILKKRGFTNFEYQVAGAGDAKYLLKVAQKFHVEDQVKIIGSIPHDKIFDWFDSIDIYIQPSLTEGLPRAVVEAMSRALPCAGTCTGGIPELIDKKYICKKKRHIASQIAELIILLSSNDEMQRTAQQNYEKAKEYSVNILESKRDKFLEKFAST